MRLIRQSDYVKSCDIELRFNIDATRGSARRELASQIEVDVAWYLMITLPINLMNFSAVTIFLARVVHNKLMMNLSVCNILFKKRWFSIYLQMEIHLTNDFNDLVANQYPHLTVYTSLQGFPPVLLGYNYLLQFWKAISRDVILGWILCIVNLSHIKINGTVQPTVTSQPLRTFFHMWTLGNLLGVACGNALLTVQPQTILALIDSNDRFDITLMVMIETFAQWDTGGWCRWSQKRQPTDDDAEPQNVLPNTVFSVINEIILHWLTVSQF